MVQGHLSHEQANAGRADQSVPDPDAHLLPAPHDVAQLAAMEAAIAGSRASGYLTRTRVLVGTAALAVAVTLPDLSLGAIAAPYARIDLADQAPPLPAHVWTPAARPAGPAYAPVVAAGDLVPASMNVSARTTYAAPGQKRPVGVLDAGSQRFDVAFARVALPQVGQVSLTLPARVAPATIVPAARQRPVGAALAAPALVPAASPPRAHLVSVPQIAVSRDLRPAPAPAPAPASASAATARASALEFEGRGDASLAASNGAIEAAFAGIIDASSAARGSIPVAPSRSSPSAPNVARQPRAEQLPAQQPQPRAIAPRAPDPQLGASAAAQAALMPKTRLDARVNGVLTGSVDFRQLDGTIAIRLRSVVDLLETRFSASEIDHLRQGQAIDRFVSLAELQAAGIPIRYNAAYDEVEFGIDYADAPNAAKVQVEQIGTPTRGTDRVGMDQLSASFSN